MDRLLEKDVTIRVLSVILALALWFQVTSEQNPLTVKTFRSIELKPQGLHEDLVLLDLSPKTVNITVQGQRRVVSALRDEELVAFVDLRAMETGKASLPIDVALPRGVQLTEVSPNQASISADTITRKKLKVEVRTAGNPSEDFVAQPAQLKMPEIIIEGPKTNVESVSRVVADIDIAGSSADVIRNVPLRLLDIDGRPVSGVRSQPASIEVHVPLRKLPPSKVVAVKPEFEGPPKEGFKVQSLVADPQTVKVRGPADVLQRLESIPTRAIDVRGVASDFDRQVELTLPPGISSVEPQRVHVKVSIVEDRAEKTIDKVPVTVKNVSPTLRATVMPAEIGISVEGPRAGIQKLTVKNIEVSVDALGLSEGEHVLTMNVSLPPGMVMIGLSSDSVTLSLRKR